MNLFLYFLLIPIIVSFLQSKAIFEHKCINSKRCNERSKQIIKHQKVFFSNSEVLIQGNYSRSMNLPLIEEGIHITECLFLNCYNYHSDGGAISCYIAGSSSYKPVFKVETSTFHECYTFLHDSKGGSLCIQGFSILSQSNCFSSCSSTLGVFSYYNVQPNFDCHINQSTFHTNAKPGIGRGSLIACSEYMLVLDNNFTNIHIGNDGSGLISTVSYEYYISRNIFQKCEGKSTIFIDINPINSIFQLLNFIDNIEHENGIISIPNNYMLSKCFFHNCGSILINCQKGKTFIYQCVFDSSLKSSKSIFKGSVQNKKPSWNGDNGIIRFGINQGLNSKFCEHKSNGGEFEEIFTPTKTPYFYGFSPNPADIGIFVCMGVLAFSLIFTITYFLWYCICSRPNLKSSIKYLKIKGADKYSEDEYSQSVFSFNDSDEDDEEKDTKNRKSSDNEDYEFDDIDDADKKTKTKTKKN